MRTGRLLVCVVALLLFAGVSHAAQSGKGVPAGSKKAVTIAAGAIELSESNKDSGMRAASSDEVVKVEGNSQNLSYECKGRSFTVNGRSNTVKLTGDCQTLKVAGTSNQVDVEGVAEINVSGVGNKVTWERGPNNKSPSVKSSGINNSVTKKNK